MITSTRVEDVFLAALEKGTPEERAAYLREACRDAPELCRRVERLLEAHPKAQSFLEHPAPPLDVTTDHPLREGPGAVIGPYKLLEQIGEGGMGVVWMAEQTQPVQRKVALKVIKPGMDSRQVIGRFEAERQALAMMDHVNIARVLDAGTTESGLPYFVMELVHGVPITTYCDDNHLTPRERLELCVPVCQAIQHAHQKGIIHRDIKPSNVMITLYDGKPVPKVIDFGVAKATEQRLTERTLFTQYGTMVGTLEYMSPEQAEMSAVGVDTRSDIYSLGVLLYELLTGSTPLSHKRLKEAAYGEILRMIREDEAPKPSTRLTESGEALASISAQRHMESAKLTKLVRGELDWIVMKCLEKDRNRRYETASGFAADVQRYLNDETVLACPPSAGYRLRKFVRRNKGAVAAGLAGILVVLLAIVGLAVSNWTVTREKDEKEIALTRVFQEKERADKNLARARRAVQQYLLKTSDSPHLKSSDLHSLRKELLETAIPFYQEFVRQDQDDPELEAERGRAYQDLSLLRRELGDQEQGLGELAEAEKIFQRLTKKFQDKPSYPHDLAGTLLSRGVLLNELGRFDQAEQTFRKALDILEPLASKHSTAPEYRATLARTSSDLGDLLREVGRSTEAEIMLRRAITLREELVKERPGTLDLRDELAKSWINLGAVLRAQQRLGPAEEAFQKALEVLDPTTLEKLPGGSPLPLKYQQVRAHAFNNLGIVRRKMGHLADAEKANRYALAIKEKLADTFPSIPQYRQELARSHNNLGTIVSELGNEPDARAAYEKAVQIYERLVADFPGMPFYAVELAGTYKNLGQLIGDSGKLEESLPWHTKAVEILERSYRQDPRFVKARESLCLAHWSRAMSLCGLSRFQEALEDWNRAIELDDGRYQNTLRLKRASNHLNLKDHVRATADAQVVTESVRAAADDLYGAACVYALSVRFVSDDAPRAESYSARAVLLLRQALAKGFKDREHLNKDADLDPLRTREDFQKLMNELEPETKKPEPRKPAG
jgi:eukaryotic-like serine/threonine-protein kinase